MAFQGSLAELAFSDIVQLVATSRKTGVFEIERLGESGRVFVRDGQIVHAETGALTGEDAVYELAVWSEGTFLFVPDEAPSDDTIDSSNTGLLMEAARRADEWALISRLIPSTLRVPMFVAKDITSPVSINPQEWSVVRRLGRRLTIRGLAEDLGWSSLETCKVLYGLVSDGLVELLDAEAGLPSERLADLTPQELAGIVEQVERRAHRLLSEHSELLRISSELRGQWTELSYRKQVEATLGFLRATEALVAADRGPKAARSFVTGVADLVARH